MMRKALPLYLLIVLTALANTCAAQDEQADRMLLYQRSIGGWPKHINEVKVDYTKVLTEAQQAAVVDDKGRNDATIDNNATTKEIRYLMKAYKQTGNKAYLEAAENGIRYLLAMQKDNGGFPQFYPDSSSYRGQITYNDNAMVNALNVLWDVAYGKNDFDKVDGALKPAAVQAVNKGIDCILKTQITVNGKLAGWCAQHDKKTLLPVKARAFELASLSGAETVGIVEFLMKVEKPSAAIRNAVTAAVQWLESVKIKGYRLAAVEDNNQPKGIDHVLVKDDASTVWARFYDLENGKPFFTGRDGVKRWRLAEIEVERRTGYAWYGTWPQKLLAKGYPAWQLKQGMAKGSADEFRRSNAQKPAGGDSSGKKTQKIRDITSLEKKNGTATAKTRLVVAQDGTGDHKTIQSAIDALPDSSATPRTIYIMPGTYREKLFITKHNIIFEGSDRELTTIVQGIARDEWRCDHKDDWGVATINIDGDDITLLNLTVINNYGFTQKEPRTVTCASDSTGKKTITANSHQMALRTIGATRLKAINCKFSAWAGDTVSPWNLVDGMFYFKDCVMEGGVDFYCPRGWAYAENCDFYTNTGTAALWHDGTGNPDYKTVLKNCRFDGYEGFRLGRFHRDAQFYLVNCTFSAAMADEDIYQVPTTNNVQWGKRVYYAGCKKEGKAYDWYKDNLSTAKGSPKAEAINAAWVFGDRWRP